MKSLLDMTLREALRTLACGAIVGIVAWLPVIALLLGPDR